MKEIFRRGYIHGQNANVDLPDTAAQGSASKSNSPAVSTGQQSPSPAPHGLRYPVFLRKAMDEIRAIGKKYLVSAKEWQDQGNLLRAERALALAKGYCDAMDLLAEDMADDCDVIEDCPNCTIGFAVKWDDGTNECPHCTMRWDVDPDAQNVKVRDRSGSGTPPQDQPS
jgi:hypothetical protein